MKKSLLSVGLMLALLGAGCAWNPFAQTPVAPPEAPSVPANPTPPSEPTTSTQPTSATPDGWKNFSYGAPVFTFNYPATAVSMTAEAADDVFALVLGSAVTSTTAQSVPTTELHVKVVAAASPEMHSCFYSETKWPQDYVDSSMVQLQHLSYSGREFCLSIEGDAGAGNVYTTYNFATAVADRVIVLSFVTHSSNCQNYEHPDTQCVAFDAARDTAGYPAILSTFNGAAATASKPLSFVSEYKTTATGDLQISVAYPHLLTTSAAVAFNALMDARIGNIVDQFNKDFAAEQKIVRQPAGVVPWTLDMDYIIHQLDDHRFTVVESGSEYTGGAHPNEVYETVTYDANANKELKLADLFAPKTDYVAEVSAASITALKNRNTEESMTDDNWITSGAGPDIKNFAYFYYADGNGLGIIFPPYQVAAYAAGPQEIELATSTLKGFLP